MEKAPKIKCVDVTKAYRDHTVLKQVNLECESGEIAGIIGRNGAGKTVLFKAICGLTAIDSGKILIDGEERRKGEVLQSVGIIIEEPAFLAHASGYKNLEYLYMIRNRVNREHLNQVLSQVGLDPDVKKPVDKYSLGMRQRLAIAQAIMEDPDILILDEPFNGLDDHGVADMRELFLELKRRGKTILVASHNPEDIRLLCDRVYQMNAGVLEQAR